MSIVTVTRVLQLAAFTLLPLAGVLWLGWDWREVLLLYWFENVAVGLATIVRIIRSRPATGPGAAAPATVRTRSGYTWTWTWNTRGIGANTAESALDTTTPATPATENATTPQLDPQTTGTIARLGMAGFFTVHYGLFTLVHGVFVFAFVTLGFGFAPPTDQRPLDWGGILLIFLVGAVVQVGVQVFGPRATDPLSKLLFAPYGRIIALHLTILGGAFLMGALQWPPIAAVLLIVLHALIDLGGWTVGSLRTKPDTGTPATSTS